jgi:glutathione S-transferase
MSEIELVAIPYSPWSEKARWALDDSGLAYKERVFVPMLGEPALRKRLGLWRGPLSVPLATFDGEVVRDSFAIARRAVSEGDSQLFPDGSLAEIEKWNELSEEALRAARSLVSGRVLEDPEARREATPPMPGFMRPMSTPLAKVGVAYLRRKYHYADDESRYRDKYRQVLATLKRALEDREGDYLIGADFSYADVAMAVALQGIKPVTDEYIKLGPATRRSWTDEELAAEFPELIEWRDRLYSKHR